MGFILTNKQLNDLFQLYDKNNNGFIHLCNISSTICDHWNIQINNDNNKNNNNNNNKDKNKLLLSSSVVLS